ncbi:WGR domain-containing protein (plasmid) [Rhizobium tumorigenes]|uniref:WGR domain-containing protein n=1 Tax=Rhizobium tumorigenes TaxID=2041385 RepID=A0AAF1KAQ7_9HYPH|nr:WGR domain-containing protein [Rhizobium tumorigenes]WFR97789.1 WGR domain-containing protein [Rhizobium tumorigenes]
MNRLIEIDSKISLDARIDTDDAGSMITQQYHLYMECIDAKRNMARYYVLSIEPTLFGDASLLRGWGRIGSRGRQKIHLFADEREALRLFLEILVWKRTRGYFPRSICGNPPERVKVAAPPQ